jgi:hypothetical protein
VGRTAARTAILPICCGHIAPCAFGTGPAGGPTAPATALAGRQLTATALTRRELALFLGASAQARRHRVLSDKALTPVLGERRVRRLQEAAGPTPFRHLLVAGAPGGAGKGSPLRTLFKYSPWPV